MFVSGSKALSNGRSVWIGQLMDRGYDPARQERLTMHNQRHRLLTTGILCSLVVLLTQTKTLAGSYDPSWASVQPKRLECRASGCNPGCGSSVSAGSRRVSPAHRPLRSASQGERGDSQSSCLSTTAHCVRLRTENVRKGMGIEPLVEASPSIIRIAGIPRMGSHRGDSFII